MKTAQLRAIDAVARNGGIRAAARQLGLTQPALTKAIKEMESNLGVQLLYRGNRGARLTEAGRQLVIRARAALREIDQAEMEMRQYSEENAGELSISISPMLGEIIFPPAYRAFRQAFPEIRVKLIEAYASAVSGMIAEGAIDFAVVLLPNQAHSANLQVDHWFDADHKIVVRKGHPLQNTEPFETFVNQDWLVTSRGSGGQYALLKEICGAKKLPMPRSVTEIPSLSLMRSLLAETDAVSIGPAFVTLEAEAPFKALECPDLPDLWRGFGMVSSASSMLSAPAAALRDLLETTCRKRFRPLGEANGVLMKPI